MKEKTGVLLVNLGTPSHLTVSGVRHYLAEFLIDSRVVEIPKPIWWLILHGIVLRVRPKKSLKMYQKVWMTEGSPLLVYSQRLANQLQKELPEASVKLAMRYGQPAIKNALDQFAQEGIQKLIIIPLFPQYSATTTASVFDAVTRYFHKKRYIPSMSFIHQYAAHPGYIQALANSVKKHWQQHGRAEKLLLSYHGLPQRNVRLGDPYYDQCCETTQLLIKELNLNENEYLMVFQSRFGAQEWLQPYCNKTLALLPQQGVTSLDVICPGFTVDCLETLEEMAETNREVFLHAGGKEYRYISALNDSVEQIQLFKDLVKLYNA